MIYQTCDIVQLRDRDLLVLSICYSLRIVQCKVIYYVTCYRRIVVRFTDQNCGHATPKGLRDVLLNGIRQCVEYCMYRTKHTDGCLARWGSNATLDNNCT